MRFNFARAGSAPDDVLLFFGRFEKFNLSGAVCRHHGELWLKKTLLK